MEKVNQYYHQIKTEAENILSKTKRIIRHFYIYRLLAFILIFSSFWIFNQSLLVSAISAFVFIAIFFWLVRKNIELERLKQRLEIRLYLINRELKALKHDYLDFPEGNEFIDPQHPYSYDLDIFGKGSLFQYINRTTTIGGSQFLAQWLTRPEKDMESILQRQQSVKEISRLREWRLNFLTEGNLIDVSNQEKSALIDTNPEHIHIKNQKFLKAVVIVIPILTLATLLIFIFKGTHIWLTLNLIINFGILYLYRKEIDRYYNLFGNKTQLINKYLNILRIIENQKFESKELNHLQHSVLKPERSSESISVLTRGMAQFEYRANLVVGILLNAFLMWDLRCILQLKKWHSENSENLKTWTKTTEIFDALISLGIYADHNPDYTFPIPQNRDFPFSAKDLGHPLLKPAKRIDNDFDIETFPKVTIITGANMAGKSTFLRAIGVNMILACAGVPVCSTEMTFTPVDIYTSIRTTDSLLKEESYFLAELKRIATIMGELRNGVPMLVILDEMLKGTNSEDKLKGSQQLVRQFARTKAATIIATHDVKLTEIEHELPDFVFNFCFEITHEGDEMIFDYKLRPGVTKTMNASLLMKKLGIID
jgi:DNA mismatch repair ATPase MutS